MWPIYLIIALNLLLPSSTAPLSWCVFPGSCFYQRIFDKEKRVKRFVESRHVRIVTIGQLSWLRLWRVDNTMLREGGHQHPVSIHTTLLYHPLDGILIKFKSIQPSLDLSKLLSVFKITKKLWEMQTGSQGSGITTRHQPGALVLPHQYTFAPSYINTLLQMERKL